MYPLNMRSAAGGYAVANDETEHRALSDANYEPKLEEPTTGGEAEELSEFELLKAEAARRDFKVPGNWGVKKLREYLEGSK